MSPAFIPSIKELAAHLTKAKAKQVLAEAMRLRTSQEVLDFMGRQVHAICPSLDLMDSA